MTPASVPPLLTVSPQSVLADLNGGQFGRAEQGARALTVAAPDAVWAWTLLGAALRAQGRAQEALAPLAQATQLAPQAADAQCNLGAAYQQLGETDLARACFERSIALDTQFGGSTFAEPYFFLGNLWLAGDPAAHAQIALPYFERALAIRPDFVEALVQKGRALKALQRLSEALVPLKRAVLLCAARDNGARAEVYCNLGDVLLAQHDYVGASEVFQAALALAPQHVLALVNLAFANLSLERYAAAQTLCEQALALNPACFEAHANLSMVCANTGRLGEALRWSESAERIDATRARLFANRGHILGALRHVNEAFGSFHKAIQLQKDEQVANSGLLFLLAREGAGSPVAYLGTARQWEHNMLSPAELVAANQRQTQRQFKRRPLLENGVRRKLRVGYLSGDFRQHVVAQFIEAVLAGHDRSALTLVAYSNHPQADAVSARIEASVDLWRRVHTLDDAALCQQIDDDAIDVLVDLSGHTDHNRLGVLARRAAPVQVHYLGYFASTGLSQIDYWLADEVLVPPAAQAHFCEAVWRLPRTWVAYQGRADAPPVHWVPRGNGEVWLGCFNNLNKITPETLVLWAKVLHALPRAKLCLKTKALGDPLNRAHVGAALNALGITSDRLNLWGPTADWQGHMSLYNALDIVLDPVGGQGGGTTTCDALWMGVPVVTLAGDRMANRMSASMFYALGHPEWVAESETDYIHVVHQLAEDVVLRQTLRPSQREKMQRSPLCDAHGLAQHLGAAYQVMFERWCDTSRADQTNSNFSPTGLLS
jgi:protein O-GlcNAc transferase